MGSRPPRLLGWRRHRLRPVPASARALALEPSRGYLPAGPCLVSLPARAPAPAGLRLLCRWPGRDELELFHELDVAPGATRVEHLVGIPRDAEALFVAAAGDGPAPAVGPLDVWEVAPVPLTALLAVRWFGRQLRAPARVPEKLGELARVLVRQGVRGALAGLVASQAARQQGAVWVAPPVAPDVRPPGPPWEGAPHVSAVPKAAFDEARRRDLASFLEGDERLALRAVADPEVSVVVVTYNRAELTLACLRHVAANVSLPSEVIVVDNASSDRTRELFDRVDGARVIANERNLGFVRGCNQGLAVASGRLVLLLNSDAFVLPGAVEAAMATFASDEGIGVMGGPLISVEGRLQEAGSVVWGDGSAQGYGRGDDPGRPEYRFRRDVDFVSGAFLITRRDLWEELGGFDDAYAPAYYEDVDYCFRARAAGSRVVYEPMAAAVHYEYGSSGGVAATEAMRRGRRTFVERHHRDLAGRPAPGASPLTSVRSAGGRPPVLVVDDRVPLAVMGSGSPRMAAILRGLVALGYEVTFFPGLPFSGTWDEVYAELPREVEIMLGWDRTLLGRFLDERRGHYRAVVVSRAHNMAMVNEILDRDRELLRGAVLIYDAEAIGAMRAVTEPTARGAALPEQEARRLVRSEVAVARAAHRVASVSPLEAEAFREEGGSEVHVLPHAVELRVTTASFDERSHFLFVGRLSEDLSPNVDGLRWFVDTVWPRIRERLGSGAELLVAGRTSPSLGRLRGNGVRLLGTVGDLTPLYGAARVFVAPLRFSAGIPLKVIEAASYGVPVVATDLLARQLGWTPGSDLLIAPVGDAEAFATECVRVWTDPRLWAVLRERALATVTETASMENFTERLRGLLDGVRRG